MRHAFPHIHVCIHTGRDGPLDIADRVIQQHFIVADMNTNRRQPSQFAVQRRGHWIR